MRWMSNKNNTQNDSHLIGLLSKYSASRSFGSFECLSVHAFLHNTFSFFVATNCMAKFQQVPCSKHHRSPTVQNTKVRARNRSSRNWWIWEGWKGQYTRSQLGGMVGHYDSGQHIEYLTSFHPVQWIRGKNHWGHPYRNHPYSKDGVYQYSSSPC